MKKLSKALEQCLPPNIVLPTEIAKFADWIESNGGVQTFEDGTIIGTIPGEYERTTQVEIYPEIDTKLWWCFDGEDTDPKEIEERVFIFARTGGDGSSAAFWLDSDGNQKIVHIGSGSGSAMMCVLADEPIDFLRLLAIGYEEICWNDNFSECPDNANLMNTEFKKWVMDSFKVSIPSRASEIVPTPTEMWDLESEDSFCSWISELNKHDF